jgi:hypothetical protein
MRTLHPPGPAFPPGRGGGMPGARDAADAPYDSGVVDAPDAQPADRPETRDAANLSRPDWSRPGWGGPRWLAAVLAAVIVVQLCAGLAALHGIDRQRLLATAPRTAGAPGGPPAAGRANLPDYTGGIGANPAAAAARTAGVRDLLARRTTALLSRDRAAFQATVDPSAPAAFRARQVALFGNLAQVPLAQWRYSVDPAQQQPVTAPLFARYRAPVWAPKVTLCYALRGYDDRCTDRPQKLTFVQRAGRWYLGGDDDFPFSAGRTWRGLWDLGPVVAYRGEHSLLLAHPANAARLPALAEQVDRAVPHVSAVWGDGWQQRVVVIVPDTQQEMAQVLGDTPALTDIAAVATADYADPVSGLVLGQRVVLNPANLDRLGATGRTVVLRHEITHLASRPVTGPALPTWLVEGFADYVGYLDTGVPLAVAAQELRADVQRSRYPTALPSNADFRFDNTRLPQAYEESWMACRLIADLAGTDGLVRLYRQIGRYRGDSAPAVEQAMRDVLGLTYAQFVERWRATVVTELS